MSLKKIQLIIVNVSSGPLFTDTAFDFNNVNVEINIKLDK